MMPPFYYQHRPSRFLWFVFGGLAATWFIKRKEIDGHSFGHCIRHRVQAPPSNGDEVREGNNNNNSNNSSPFGDGLKWEMEGELTRQATEKMTEISEVTIDQVLNTAVALKAKLVEYRIQREQQEKIAEKKREEERRRHIV